MNIKLNDLPPVQITLPVFLCFMWHHLGWFLGLTQIAFVALVGASDSLSPGALKFALVASGLVTAIAGYVKANPPPSINSTGVRP